MSTAASPWAAEAAKLLSRLNSYQRLVLDTVLAPGGPTRIRILATAGAGKTGTVTALLANGLNQGVLPPTSCIVTTFTNKAGGELKERIKKGTDPSLFAALEGSRHIGTFHAITGAWLRKNPGSAPHKWLPTLNLDVVKVGDERRAWEEETLASATKAGVTLPADAEAYQKPATILQDIIQAPGWPDAWKKYGIWEPINIRKWYEEHDVELPEEIPDGRQYALAIGVIRGNALHPKHTPATQAIRITDPANEDNVLDFVGPRAVADYFETAFGLPMLWRVWSTYEDIKARIGAYDFEDQLYEFWRRGTLGAKLVVVDEAQDNTLVQRDIALGIAQRGGGKLVFVGDLRQSIYSFRGANPALLRDASEAAGYTTLEIPTNYRSGSRVVSLGTDVCYTRSPRVDPQAEPFSWSPGSPAIPARRVDPAAVRVVSLGEEAIACVPSALEHLDVARTQEFPGTVRMRTYPTAPEEFAGTGSEVAALLQQGIGHEDIAILARTNAEGAFFEMGLLTQGIKALRIGRGTPYFDTAVISRALGWLAAALLDDAEGGFIALTQPKRYRYMKMAPVRSAFQAGKGRGLGAVGVLTGLLGNRDANPARSPEFDTAVRDTIRDLREIKKLPWPAPVQAITEKILPQALEEADEEEEQQAKIQVSEDGDRASLDSLLVIANLFPTYEAFSGFREALRKNRRSYTEDQIARMDDAERARFRQEQKERVTISSIHGAKGLEWGFVFLSSTLGVFPSARAVTPTQVAEEQRLFYVGATRARDCLTLTCADENAQGKPAGPSRFLTNYVVPFLADPEASAPDPYEIPGWTRLFQNEHPERTGQVVWVRGGRTLELLRAATGSGWGLYWSSRREGSDPQEVEITSADHGVFPSPGQGLIRARELAAGLPEQEVTPGFGEGPGEDGPVPPPPPPPEEVGPRGLDPYWLAPLVTYLLKHPTTEVRVGSLVANYLQVAQRLAPDDPRTRAQPQPKKGSTPAPASTGGHRQATRGGVRKGPKEAPAPEEILPGEKSLGDSPAEVYQSALRSFKTLLENERGRAARDAYIRGISSTDLRTILARAANASDRENDIRATKSDYAYATSSALESASREELRRRQG